MSIPATKTPCDTCHTPLAPDDASLCPNCTAGMLLGLDRSDEPAHVELSERRGFVIPGYKLHAQVGRGGMGRVFRATRESDNSEVAVKILNAPWICSDEICERFHREVEITSSLDDSRTVDVIESGLDREDKIFFYVMEFVDGLNIDEHVKQKNLSEKDTLLLFIDLCKAVSAAHNVGVIHRDLKPANVRITTGGQIKILDFGLAKLIDTGQPESNWTRADFIGTPGYAAPEQADASRPPDVKIDVYSLGVLLSEILPPRTAGKKESIQPSPQSTPKPRRQNLETATAPPTP